jgi:CheY-like chemotaxis protein
MPTVLLVDDEPIIRMLLVETFQNAGLEVIEASDGEEASRVLDSDTKIDLLMTDLVMPGQIQGTDIIELSRRKRPDTRIIAFSGDPERVDKISFIKVLHKPFDCHRAVTLALELLEPIDEVRQRST